MKGSSLPSQIAPSPSPSNTMSATTLPTITTCVPSQETVFHDEQTLGDLLCSPPKLLSSSSDIVSFDSSIKAPFDAIRRLFDYLRGNPEVATQLNEVYPSRGIVKTAATKNAQADQKFTIDLSVKRNSQIPQDLHATLARAGFDEVMNFFDKADKAFVAPILSILSEQAGVDLQPTHRDGNINYRLCDYNPITADPLSDNGCGEHTDYGTFSIIFQDGTPGLEMEDSSQPGSWVQVPGDATVVLSGWCAVILSGGHIRATRHRVRRIANVRRLSAVIFVAPDLDTKLKPLSGVKAVRPFTQVIMNGVLTVGEFKKVMGKKWRRREGNEDSDGAEDYATQDNDIVKLVWG
ncbi:hypothetical protein B0I35DRAFT_435727 [Stachybotrys elegans]|uniref:Fe2OG dioxygenase domain-containing protein n=1 Tax=Stachybotrys elegans TaxID=80388 RepID=A0A8K0STK6_9HYPO|nr:hypothetical protein B0I35DRAFT_435727 [Stachybotrys elegans]